MTNMVTDPRAQTDSPSAVALEMLTDEELSILAGSDSIVVSPFLDQLSEADRPAVLRTAYRSLVARGILDPPPSAPAEMGSGTVEVELPVRQDVHAMITLRRAARAVVAIARTTAGFSDYWYAHLVDDVSLLEELTPDGIHRFALTGTDDLADAVVNAAMHPAAANGSGPALQLPITDDPTPPENVVRRVGAAAIRSDLVVRSSGDTEPTLYGLFTGPKGSWRFRAVYGAQRPVELTAVTVEALQREIREVIAAALERLASAEGSRNGLG